MSFLDQYADKIRDRRSFVSAQLCGYRTKGGTYVLASSAAMNDDDRDHDLMAILPDDTVVQLRYNANIQPVQEILTRSVQDALGRRES